MAQAFALAESNVVSLTLWLCCHSKWVSESCLTYLHCNWKSFFSWNLAKTKFSAICLIPKHDKVNNHASNIACFLQLQTLEWHFGLHVLSLGQMIWVHCSTHLLISMFCVASDHFASETLVLNLLTCVLGQRQMVNKCQIWICCMNTNLVCDAHEAKLFCWCDIAIFVCLICQTWLLHPPWNILKSTETVTPELWHATVFPYWQTKNAVKCNGNCYFFKICGSTSPTLFESFSSNSIFVRASLLDCS